MGFSINSKLSFIDSLQIAQLKFKKEVFKYLIEEFDNYA